MNESLTLWLQFAREDLRASEILLNDGIFNLVCFHAQQCVEKSLKAIITHRMLPLPRSHNISTLLDLLPEQWFSDLRQGIQRLDDYYIPTRYPDALPGALPEGLPDRADAEQALGIARLVLERVNQLVV